MKTLDLCQLLQQHPYPGRGIVLGRSADGQKAVIAYFIMGRSENSRNRVFVETTEDGIRTQAFDESKMTDPSLIIYAPCAGGRHGATIVTNGDQTDTIREGLPQGSTFAAGACAPAALSQTPPTTPPASPACSDPDGELHSCPF